MPPVWHPVRHLSIQTVRFSELFGAITLYFLLKRGDLLEYFIIFVIQ